MAKANEHIVTFDDVSFEHGVLKPILDEVSFPIRRGGKFALMGQNGAGKSTLFHLLTGELEPTDGRIIRVQGLTIALSRQTLPREELTLTVRAFFKKYSELGSSKPVYDIDPRIDAILDVVHLDIHAPSQKHGGQSSVSKYDRVLSSFSGGQQARLLLASALIQNPDLLLLDEPTNNLDHAGIEHLTTFLKNYDKTVLVISHDAHFLNAFTDGVLYLDVRTRKLEQYDGNYTDVQADIAARIEKENRKNAQLAKEIQENKDKANFFANKGGQMRLVAKRMREKAEEMEEEKVDVRKEDKTIRPFVIPCQDFSASQIVGDLITIHSARILANKSTRADELLSPKKLSSSEKLKQKKVVTPEESNEPDEHGFISKPVGITLRKNNHLLLKGPNGIGKSTLLEAIARETATGSTIQKGVVVGYYRQDFSTLDFTETVHKSLAGVTRRMSEDQMRSVAAGFLLTGDVMHTKIGSLSEGQKGLVAFCRLVLEAPGLLILDEPTNHINFRHLPEIAKALDAYTGAMIVVSHVPDFIAKIRIDTVVDLAA
jgi:ATPase subunit of ABC transporter with duplicated ATPase domains